MYKFRKDPQNVWKRKKYAKNVMRRVPALYYFALFLYYILSGVFGTFLTLPDFVETVSAGLVRSGTVGRSNKNLLLKYYLLKYTI